MPNILNHPLAQNFLAEIRDQQANRATVRHHIRALAVMLFYEATRDLPTETVKVRTPLAETDGLYVGATVGLVPILRAGLGLMPGIQDLLPLASVYHVGFVRDEATLEASCYLNKLPDRLPPSP